MEPENKVRVGVDDFAQKQAGDLLFIRLFPVGKDVQQGKRFSTLETALPRVDMGNPHVLNT